MAHSTNNGYLRILSIHFRTIVRLIAELGIPRILLSLVALVPVLMVLGKPFNWLETNNYKSLALIGIFWSLLVSIHLKRKDKSFLLQNGLSGFKLHLMEYGILSLPFMAGVIALKSYLYIPAFPLIIAISVPVLMRINGFARAPKRWLSFRFLPGHAYELKTGLPSLVWWIALINILIFVIGMYWVTSPVALGIQALMFGSIYAKCESVVMLKGLRKRALGLMFAKAKTTLTLYLICSIPALSLSVFSYFQHQNTNHLFFPAWILLVGCLTIVFSIGLKYYLFQQGKKLDLVHFLVMTVTGFVTLLLYTAPLGIIATIIVWQLAKKNLRTQAGID